MLANGTPPKMLLVLGDTDQYMQDRIGQEASPTPNAQEHVRRAPLCSSRDPACKAERIWANNTTMARSTASSSALLTGHLSHPCVTGAVPPILQNRCSIANELSRVGKHQGVTRCHRTHDAPGTHIEVVATMVLTRPEDACLPGVLIDSHCFTLGQFVSRHSVDM